MILHRITPFMYHILFDNGVAMEKTILLYQWKLLNIFGVLPCGHIGKMDKAISAPGWAKG